jgi:hypothetical protein
MYTYTLASDVPLPADIAIRIPSRIGEPSAVAAAKTSNDLYNITYKRQTDGDWTYIFVKTSDPIIHIEYYDPNLIQNKIDRHFDFTWINDFKLDSITFHLQQPVGSKNFKVSPSLKNENLTTVNGLDQLNADIVPPDSGKSLSLSIDYQKDSDQLSIASLQEQTAPLTTTTPTVSPSTPDSLPLIIIASFGIILILIFGIFWYVNLQRSQRKSERSRKRSTSQINREQGKPTSNAGSTLNASFCQKCGQKTISGDQFCRSCGNDLRIDR